MGYRISMINFVIKKLRGFDQLYCIDIGRIVRQDSFWFVF